MLGVQGLQQHGGLDHQQQAQPSNAAAPGPKAWRDEPAYHRGPKNQGPLAAQYQPRMAIPVPKQSLPKQPKLSM
eukprot:8003883-Karenia_brevis.AAC.1